MGCSAFARRYWRNHYCFLFLQVLRWFTSLRCLLTAYVFSGGSFGISQRGFPHSEIPGSKLICSSPGLIAAYRVLHRLLVPRHSPYTLSSLTINKLETRLTWTYCAPSTEAPSAQHPHVSHMHTACVWSVKLPFAEYSVVKESPPSLPAAATAWRAAFHLAQRSVYSTGRPRRLPSRSSHPLGVFKRSVPRAKAGEYRARTGDLLVANQALSQLS